MQEFILFFFFKKRLTKSWKEKEKIRKKKVLKGTKSFIFLFFKNTRDKMYLNLLILKRKLHIKLQYQSGELLTCRLNPICLSRLWFSPWRLLSQHVLDVHPLLVLLSMVYISFFCQMTGVTSIT